MGRLIEAIIGELTSSSMPIGKKPKGNLEKALLEDGPVVAEAPRSKVGETIREALIEDSTPVLEPSKGKISQLVEEIIGDGPTITKGEKNPIFTDILSDHDPLPRKQSPQHLRNASRWVTQKGRDIAITIATAGADEGVKAAIKIANAATKGAESLKNKLGERAATRAAAKAAATAEKLSQSFQKVVLGGVDSKEK